ncbi:hypothetical protein TSTA_071540 [Talaromyces stipitatus ATCC 10500]|uniref:Uncharacterized protein n=1 Tax=Talaromyces stipitatus (strain ATCC 10500 / CBS 375.48 / QM 6759 / NRRL 1006) TaxID=441959 RepID=B8LUI4_TALSN|nr:uncharacterized protein TSTA_071540 [Talaromyces stipitatus ATCC 10500]EED23757.1 hypothetical protein TSTA_071540 [Talaromyces stipitatus ATCC 10500]
MAHVVDLGTQSFNLGGQCLVSRATATLIYDDNTNATGSKSRRVSYQDSWIALKQELALDLQIETCSIPAMSVPNFVKQAVETGQASLIRDNPYLRVSRIYHEYRCLTNSVALNVSLVLIKIPDLSPQILPKRLPRRAKQCVAEPHPPPGIDRATLSRITISMKGVGQCAPWNFFLTKPSLRLSHHNPFTGNHHVQDNIPSQQAHVSTLSSSLRKYPPLAPRQTTDSDRRHTQSVLSDDKSVQHSRNVLSYREIGSLQQDINFHEMVRCSIRSLVNGNSQQYKSLVTRSAIEDGPSLSDIAPLLFKPGHYERAGLIPMVTRSMARIFRAPQSLASKERTISVKSKLRARYGNRENPESADIGHLTRAMIKCVVWTALQRGSYKAEWPKMSTCEDLGTMLFSDDCMLTEEVEEYDCADEQMIYSTTSSVTNSDDILSNTDVEPNSSYSSLSSPEKLFHRFSDKGSLSDGLHHDFTSGESAIDDSESDIISRPDTEREDIIIGSSSLPPTACDMFTDSEVMTPSSPCSEVFNQDNECRDQHDEDMMDDSSSISILSSFTNQYALEELKQETEMKLEHDETEDILMSI